MSEGVAESQSIYINRQLPQRLPAGTRLRGRARPDVTDVFCGDRSNQPATLFSSEHFYVVPDLFPITPGHILIIPKHHFPAYAAIPAGWERELEADIARVRAFVREAYGREAMVWENGGAAAGQSVHHAHIHVIPLPPSVTRLPEPRFAIRMTAGLAQARAWWSGTGNGRPYHLMEFGGDRRLLPGGSPDVRDANIFKSIVLEIPLTPDGRRWVRKQNPIEVARTTALYERWARRYPYLESRAAVAPSGATGPTTTSNDQRGLAA